MLTFTPSTKSISQVNFSGSHCAAEREREREREREKGVPIMG